MVTDATMRIVLTAVDKASSILQGALAKVDAATEASYAKGKILIGVGAGIEAFLAGATAKTASYASEVERLTLALGISSEAASKYAGIARIAGVDSETIARSMMRLERQLLSLGSQGMMAKSILASIGVTIQRTSSGAIDQGKLLEDLAGAYEKIQDPAKRAQILFQLFTMRGMGLAPVLHMGSEAIKEYTQHLKNMGMIFPEDELKKWHMFGMEWGLFKEALIALGKIMGTEFRPVMEVLYMVVVKFAELLNKMPEIMKRVSVAGIALFGVFLMLIGAGWTMTKVWGLLAITKYKVVIWTMILVDWLKKLWVVLTTGGLISSVTSAGNAFGTVGLKIAAFLFYLIAAVAVCDLVYRGVESLVDMIMSLIMWIHRIPGLGKMIPDDWIPTITKIRDSARDAWKTGAGGPVDEAVSKIGATWDKIMGKMGASSAEAADKAGRSFGGMKDMITGMFDPIGRLSKEILNLPEAMGIPALMQSLKGLKGDMAGMATVSAGMGGYEVYGPGGTTIRKGAFEMPGQTNIHIGIPSGVDAAIFEEGADTGGGRGF